MGLYIQIYPYLYFTKSNSDVHFLINGKNYLENAVKVDCEHNFQMTELNKDLHEIAVTYNNSRFNTFIENGKTHSISINSDRYINRSYAFMFKIEFVNYQKVSHC